MALHFQITEPDYRTPRYEIVAHAVKIRNEANPFFITTDTFGMTTDELREFHRVIGERLAAIDAHTT